MKRFVVALAFLALAPLPAFAGPILAGTVNGVLFCATDNNAVCTNGAQLPDLDPAVGSLQLANTTLGGVTVNSSTHTQVIAGTQNSLNSQSLQIINTTGGAITGEVSVGGINYTGPVEAIQSSGSGTWQNAAGSTIAMRWYADLANGQGGETATDHPGLLLATFGDLAGTGVDSFAAGPFLTAFLAGGPFSMTTNFQLNLVAGGQLISRGQNMIADVVPEPASMLLLGTGLVALARMRRRR